MLSKVGERTGKQEPRIQLEPPSAYSDGPDAAELGAAYGLDPFPWERTVLNAWLSRDESDSYAAKTAGIAVPRQNGKNAIVELRELFGLVTTGEKILHTAHEVRTARKSFLRLARFFEDDRNYPELSELLVKNGVRKTNGQEMIVLKNGGSIEFSARTRGANRGYTVDLVIFDEAQELTDEQLSAIMYALGAAPSGNRQMIYLGTPPGDNSPGDVFERVRGQALKIDPPEGLSWHEWSVEEIGDVTDRDRWYDTNPSMGYLLTEEWTANELLNAGGNDAEFARERLGWWATDSQKTAINIRTWNSLATEEPPEDGLMAYGVKFSADGRWVSLAVCLKPPEGSPHVELIQHRDVSHGIDWLGQWLIDHKDVGAAFVIDGKSNQNELVAQLIDGGVPKKAIITPNAGGVIASATRFMNAIKEKRLTHFAQPALNVCVERARKRPIGKDGGWGWGCIGDEDSSPLEAVSFAYWGAMTTKRHPGRRVRAL